MKIRDLAVDERKDRLTGVGARVETLACLKIQNAQHVLYFWKVGGVKYIKYDIPVCQMKDTQRDKLAWTSFTIVFNILICVVVLKITHNINTCKDHGISYHFSKAPRCPTDAIFYCILVVLSIRPVAIKRFPQQCWMTSWRSSTANETITWPFPIIALPTQVLWVIVMLLLLLVSCGFLLWQPTVIGYFSKLFLLFSVQAGQDGSDGKPNFFGDCQDERFHMVVPSK